ncbi:hypothetical protein [Streptomyces sp. NPDC088760]|uniref:hypothetical protein n=1 Tax=Streptomyces sp. NPDC088760 TaxID=3365890 RepID=UPI00380B845E
MAVLLAVIVVWRLRRRTEARSRFGDKLTVVIALALGVLIAPTPAGQASVPVSHVLGVELGTFSAVCSRVGALIP